MVMNFVLLRRLGIIMRQRLVHVLEWSHVFVVLKLRHRLDGREVLDLQGQALGWRLIEIQKILMDTLIEGLWMLEMGDVVASMMQVASGNL